ncbi:MAG: pyridoxal-phosphate dependent enzyme [Halioglobus sp.]
MLTVPPEALLPVPPEELLQRLSPAPVAGLSLSNVSVLRLDLCGSHACGNKSFKLRPYLQRATAQSLPLLSFGGAWSNHLHALAAAGFEQGLKTLGIVRGGESETATLRDVERWGMRVQRVSRSEYRRRGEADYLAYLQDMHGPCVVVPEGGASTAAASACADIAQLINQLAPQSRHVVLAVGTGTTLAGLAAGLRIDAEVVGISALRGATDLDQRVTDLLAQLPADAVADWRILHEFHAGGFARCSADLKAFILEFEAVHGIPLEPVYTGKALHAVWQMVASGELAEDASVLVVHTGGLQGRRGYDWLSSSVSS